MNSQIELKDILRIGNSPCLITLVGAGGKTSLMYELAKEVRTLGLSVITSTTTRIFRPTENLVPVVHLTEDDEWRHNVIRDVSRHGHVCVAKSHDITSNKLLGLGDLEISHLIRMAQVTIVEGDGAAGHAVKGVEDWEPRIPSVSNIVIYVVGLDCIGKPANCAVVHKLHKFLHLTGQRQNRLISLTSLARLITHPDGGFRNVPESSDLYVVLNKSDTVRSFEVVQKLGAMIISLGRKRVKAVMTSGLYDNRRITTRIIPMNRI